MTEEISEIQRLRMMGELFMRQAVGIAALELQLKAAKEAFERTEREDLPMLMQEIGMSSFKLEDGTSIEVTPEVMCNINDERRAQAHRWLVEKGFGGLIKTAVVTEFGRGEIEQAADYQRLVIEKFPDHVPMVKDVVHPATLKSFVKEQLSKPVEEGAPAEEFPKELFGVFEFNRAKITLPKAKKK